MDSSAISIEGLSKRVIEAGTDRTNEKQKAEKNVARKYSVSFRLERKDFNE